MIVKATIYIYNLFDSKLSRLDFFFSSNNCVNETLVYFKVDDIFFSLKFCRLLLCNVTKKKRIQAIQLPRRLQTLCIIAAPIDNEPITPSRTLFFFFKRCGLLFPKSRKDYYLIITSVFYYYYYY